MRWDHRCLSMAEQDRGGLVRGEARASGSASSIPASTGHIRSSVSSRAPSRSRSTTTRRSWSRRTPKGILPATGPHARASCARSPPTAPLPAFVFSARDSRGAGPFFSPVFGMRSNRGSTSSLAIGPRSPSGSLPVSPPTPTSSERAGRSAHNAVESNVEVLAVISSEPRERIDTILNRALSSLARVRVRPPGRGIPGRLRKQLLDTHRLDLRLILRAPELTAFQVKNGSTCASNVGGPSASEKEGAPRCA